MFYQKGIFDVRYDTIVHLFATSKLFTQFCLWAAALLRLRFVTLPCEQCSCNVAL